MNLAPCLQFLLSAGVKRNGYGFLAGVFCTGKNPDAVVKHVNCHFFFPTEEKTTSPFTVGSQTGAREQSRAEIQPQPFFKCNIYLSFGRNNLVNLFDSGKNTFCLTCGAHVYEEGKLPGACKSLVIETKTYENDF